MKRIALILTGSVALTLTAQAQWVVYDPTVQAQLIINTAQEIAKFAEMINNEVKQIQQLTDQVQTMHHYVDLFGDPAKFVPASITALTADLKKTELGQTLTDLEASVDATVAMGYTAHGLFEAVKEEFTTPNGTKVKRREQPYRSIAAIQQTTDNYLAVSKDVAGRRVVLKTEIATTTEALKAAKTDAEVQKLTGVLAGLTVAIQSADQELNQATASTLVQDIANRADARRQDEAKREQQHAEFSEAAQKYGKTFQLPNAPAKFPIR